MENFNFIITCSRGQEFHAVFEVEHVFSLVGDKSVNVWESGVQGLLLARTSLDPIHAVRSIKRLADEKIDVFNLTLRYIPILTVVKTDIDKMKSAVKELASLIKPDESFRITVEKRRTSLHSRDIITALADIIDRRIDLKNPDKVVLVEIIGGVTGISIIRPDDILSITLLKRKREF